MNYLLLDVKQESTNQQNIVIPMVTNCALLPTDEFLYCYDFGFIQFLLRRKDKRTTWPIFLCHVKQMTLFHEIKLNKIIVDRTYYI